MDTLSMLALIAGTILITFLLVTWWNDTHDTKPRDPYRR